MSASSSLKSRQFKFQAADGFLREWGWEAPDAFSFSVKYHPFIGRSIQLNGYLLVSVLHPCLHSLSLVPELAGAADYSFPLAFGHEIQYLLELEIFGRVWAARLHQLWKVLDSCFVTQPLHRINFSLEARLLQ